MRAAVPDLRAIQRDPVWVVVSQHDAHELRRDREPVAKFFVGNRFEYRAVRGVEDHSFGTGHSSTWYPMPPQTSSPFNVIGPNTARSGSATVPAPAAGRTSESTGPGAVRVESVVTPSETISAGRAWPATSLLPSVVPT